MTSPRRRPAQQQQEQVPGDVQIAAHVNGDILDNNNAQPPAPAAAGGLPAIFSTLTRMMLIYWAIRYFTGGSNSNLLLVDWVLIGSRANGRQNVQGSDHHRIAMSLEVGNRLGAHRPLRPFYRVANGRFSYGGVYDA
jgi:hypothetical protein